MLRILTILCAASLVGCASTQLIWEKDGVPTADVTADIAECRRLAFDEMWRFGWERNWPPRFYDPRFMPPYYRSPQPFWRDFPSSLERESALIDFCMHSKGYRLRRLPY